MFGVDLIVTEIDSGMGWFLASALIAALAYAAIRGIKVHVYHHRDEDDE